MANLDALFSPVTIGMTELKNRIVSTAHQTNHVADGIPTPAMVTYHRTRAKGGVGLIILEAAAVHPSGMLTTHTIAGYDERVVPAYRQIADAVHRYETRVFSQLFHGGREVVSSTYRHAAYAPSSVPSLRFGVMPRAMTIGEIHEVVKGFALSARLAKEAGLDGVEICCSHGYLPAQFWSEHTNRRTDAYGGCFENRMRFIVEVCQAVWEAVGEEFTVGIRMSADEKTPDGTTVADAVKIVEYLVDQVRLDFINVTAGDSSTYSGSTHIVPPSPMEHGYVASDAFRIRMAGAVPVFVGSRVVDPVEANRIIASGQADAVGMTRALIVDPEMPEKARRGDLSAIEYCIGCLQACIGHYHRDLAIGCVQNPVAGREKELETRLSRKARRHRRVVVIGAGPAGLKAAFTASEQGDEVTVFEEQTRVGGLLNVLRRAPMRQELADTMLDNFLRKLERVRVDLRLGQRGGAAEVLALRPDLVVNAVGASPYRPHIPGIGDVRVLDVDDVFTRSDVGDRVVVMDYFGDWSGIEAALFLAMAGKSVALYTARLYVGEGVHQYLRNEYLKALYDLRVQMHAHYELTAIEDALVVRNLFTHRQESIKHWDSVVLAMGRVPRTALSEELSRAGLNVISIGDALAPRTLEEAMSEGLEAGLG
jgi:2,4-dienoyl-CoA reductase-like NADH-dependent reductase (Old Yellow Enzyme family)